MKKAEPKKEVEKGHAPKKEFTKRRPQPKTRTTQNKIKNVTILKIKDVMSKTIREIKNVQTKNHTNANGNRPSFKKEPARNEARSNQQGQVERPRNNQNQKTTITIVSNHQETIAITIEKPTTF